MDAISGRSPLRVRLATTETEPQFMKEYHKRSLSDRQSRQLDAALPRVETPERRYGDVVGG